MRITKEMIAKLPEKKQIEYIERMKAAKDKIGSDFLFITYLKWLVYTLAFSLIVIPLWKLAYPDMIINIVTMFGTMTKVLSTAMVIGLYRDIIFLMYGVYRMSKIKLEYFKQKIEVKN
jgi:polyferredoxin